MTKILLDNNFAQVSLTSLSDSEETQEVNALTLSHTHCQASISLYGGQVLSFQPTGYQNLLWLSEQARYQTGQAIRGGIPICWPWFGINPKQVSANPSIKHGFARQLLWHVESIEADDVGVTIILILEDGNQHQLWPSAFKLRQTLFFGEKLTQSLAISNVTDDTVQFTFAFHNYFRVSDTSKVNIDTLTDVPYHDKVTGNSAKQVNPLRFVGEIDRVYQTTKKMTVVDSHWQRVIEVNSDNCQQWVLWNPGAKLASNMADIHEHGEKQFVCLESANTQWRNIPAGETVTCSQQISVRAL
jgi:glucose-6-phosphate 1-epimerase